MNIEELRNYCLMVKGSEESLPFGDEHLVFKIFDKMFALLPLDSSENLSISLKCDPDKAVELRERYDCVKAAYHFNKKYWNTIFLNQNMNDEEVLFWIQHSVEEVLKKLPKKMQNEYRAEEK